MSRMNPMSSIRSASSSTSISTRPQVQRPLPGVVEQAARRGDQDVHALTQRLDLRGDAHAAENHRRLQR